MRFEVQNAGAYPELLAPRYYAGMHGVPVATVAHWAREGYVHRIHEKGDAHCFLWRYELPLGLKYPHVMPTRMVRRLYLAWRDWDPLPPIYEATFPELQQLWREVRSHLRDGSAAYYARDGLLQIGRAIWELARPEGERLVNHGVIPPQCVEWPEYGEG